MKTPLLIVTLLSAGALAGVYAAFYLQEPFFRRSKSKRRITHEEFLREKLTERGRHNIAIAEALGFASSEGWFTAYGFAREFTVPPGCIPDFWNDAQALTSAASCLRFRYGVPQTFEAGTTNQDRCRLIVAALENRNDKL